MIVVALPGLETDDAAPSATTGWVKLALGVLLLAAAAGASLGALPLSTSQTVAAVAVFTLIAALTVAVPVMAYLVAGARLDPALDRTKAWLIENNTAVMAVLLLVFGVNLLGDGLQILL